MASGVAVSMVCNVFHQTRANSEPAPGMMQFINFFSNLAGVNGFSGLPIAKSFARIHVANLINFGIVPMTLVNEADYDKISESDEISIVGFAEAIREGDEVYLTVKNSGEKIALRLTLTDRQRAILLAGGMLNYTKENS